MERERLNVRRDDSILRNVSLFLCQCDEANIHLALKKKLDLAQTMSDIISRCAFDLVLEDLKNNEQKPSSGQVRCTEYSQLAHKTRKEHRLFDS